MAESPKTTKLVNLSRVVDENVTFEVRSAEAPDERQSRLKREEAEVEHKLRMQQAEDGHKRLIGLIVHIFVMVIVAVAFSASV